MLEVSLKDVGVVLADFGIDADAVSFSELQRYNYEEQNPQSKEVRLIVRADLADGSSVVIRFKKEADAPQSLIERQCEFAEMLRDGGILSPGLYRSENAYARMYMLNGYDVVVTVEDFVEGEVTCVDAEMAEATGKLLARMHNIAQYADIHVDNSVLFDPFEVNDLFDYGAFRVLGDKLTGKALELHQEITRIYEEYMEQLALLKTEPRYAVQGDISDCNLFRTKDGELGVFDFNRCGDNNLFCDAVMQAVFEARLMDYPEELENDSERVILPAFLNGYRSVRPFTAAQIEWYPYLYAVIDAFWSGDIKWNEDSLLNEFEKGNIESVVRKLEVILEKLRIRCVLE